MFYTVYKITNMANGKIYVGVHQTDDLDDEYMGSGKLIKRAIEKYGIENFEKEYIQIFDNPEDMFEMESTLVNTSFVMREDTYNMKEGGLGGDTSKHINYDSDDRRQKIGEGVRRKFQEDEHYRMKRIEQCSKNLCSFEGKQHTDETKRKIGEANSTKQSGSGNSQYGTCWIHSLVEQRSIRIKRDELDEYLAAGWTKGRKIKWN